MPKEKINHAPEYAPEYVVQADPGDGSAAPEGVIYGEVSNIAWTPLAGIVGSTESPGAWLPDAPIRKDAELAVGWLRDSWLQLSIEGDPEYFEMAATHPDGDADGLTRTSVYTPPLSRDEVNKLIRSLRRARDQVFGRDE